jgi:hypothetical protein
MANGPSAKAILWPHHAPAKMQNKDTRKKIAFTLASCDSGVGSAQRVLWTGKTINEVMAFRHVGQRVIGIEADRAIGLAQYFGIVIGFRISRPVGVF